MKWLRMFLYGCDGIPGWQGDICWLNQLKTHRATAVASSQWTVAGGQTENTAKGERSQTNNAIASANKYFGTLYSIHTISN